MILEILKTASDKSEWAAWVTSDAGQAAEEVRGFLRVCFLNLHADKQRKLIRRIQQAVPSDIEATILELVTHELLCRLDLRPEFDPSINGTTPDISIEIQGTKFIADVFVTHNPLKTVIESTEDTLFTADAGERAQKIAGAIKRKSSKYEKTGSPLVLFVFLGDRSVKVLDIEQAVFGVPLCDIGWPELSLSGVQVSDRINSVFLSEIEGKPKHQNLSAVVACDWFDTCDRSRPGKRLHCRVFHHWNPIVPLPRDAFAGFLQVIWEREQVGWKGGTSGNPTAVVRFTADGRLEFGNYTPGSSW